MQQRAPPPTHFVGLRCTSASVAAATGAHQARLLALNAAYEHTFCKPAEAHVTLCVLTLPDALSVDAAAAALRAVRWRALSPQLTGQLARFGSRVLFLELSSDGERDQLCALQAASGCADSSWSVREWSRAFRPSHYCRQGASSVSSLLLDPGCRCLERCVRPALFVGSCEVAFPRCRRWRTGGQCRFS